MRVMCRAGKRPEITVTLMAFTHYRTRIRNRPLAAKPSRDLLFIKLWAATLRMPEMEKRVENIKMAKFEAPGIKE